MDSVVIDAIPKRPLAHSSQVFGSCEVRKTLKDMVSVLKKDLLILPLTLSTWNVNGWFDVLLVP